MCISFGCYNKVRLVVYFLGVASLVACGAGGLPGSSKTTTTTTTTPALNYGSIAVSTNNGAWAVVSNKPDQATADSNAVANCTGSGGIGCSVVDQFGPAQCGAIARSTTAQGFGGVWVFGTGVASTSSAATATALSRCSTGLNAGIICALGAAGGGFLCNN